MRYLYNLIMKVLILTNNDSGLYKFRGELVKELLKQYEVMICFPYGSYVEELCNMGCTYIDCQCLNRRGTNIREEIELMHFYKALLKKLVPDIVLTYTIKPNVYGGMACARLGIPYIVNVTGLGTAVENDGFMQKLTIALYRRGLKKAQKVFFQNKNDMRFMTSRKIVGGEYGLLPGSGVNLEEYSCMEYPKSENPIIFVVIGRLMKDKGTDELLEAAGIIRKRYPYVIFRLIGYYDEDIYRDKVKQALKAGAIEYFGSQPDVKGFLKDCHAVIHASYHEGMSNVLLEAAACGRPVIATDVPGCIETFIPDVSGVACKAGNTGSLVEAIEKFLRIPLADKQRMGQMGRKKIEKEFDRRIVIERYLEETEKIMERRAICSHS